MIRPLKASAMAMLGLLLATGAFAQSGPVASSCGTDIAQFCADKSHNGEVRACLAQHHTQLSETCRAALDSTGPGKGMGPPIVGTSAPVMTTCAADLNTFCAKEPHDGRARSCLERNYRNVSQSCKAALQATGGGNAMGPGPKRRQ